MSYQRAYHPFQYTGEPIVKMPLHSQTSYNPRQKIEEENLLVQTPQITKQKTLPPQKVSVSNYTKRDVNSARTQLRLLKQKMSSGSCSRVMSQQTNITPTKPQVQRTSTMKSAHKYAPNQQANAVLKEQPENLRMQRPPMAVQDEKQQNNYRKAFVPNLPAAQHQQERQFKKTAQKVAQDPLNTMPDEIIPSAYGGASKNNEIPDEYEEPVRLLQCPTCSRKFNEKSYGKHVENCKKVFVDKRKKFDTAEHRKVEAELEYKDSFVPKGKAATQKNFRPGQKKTEEPLKSTKSKWKQQSEQFRNALRGVSNPSSSYTMPGGGAATAPADDFQQCKGCKRTFNEDALTRHEPICLKKMKVEAMTQGNKRKAQTMSSGFRR